MRQTFATIMAVLATAGLVTVANAADKTVKVRFDTGKTFATVKGSIRGYDGVNYVLDARGGQTISVLFSPSSAACYFNFYEPGAGETAAFNGSISGNEYADTLPSTGRSRVQVYQMRSAARRKEVCNYSVTFEITG
jgi:hypothetical protein